MLRRRWRFRKVVQKLLLKKNNDEGKVNVPFSYRLRLVWEGIEVIKFGS